MLQLAQGASCLESCTIARFLQVDFAVAGIALLNLLENTLQLALLLSG
ncbi:hypothetical protein [Synechococcus elongatus]